MAIRFARKRRMLSSKSRTAQHGFTLIEVMITVLIIGVLAAIAFASYEYAVIKSRRAAAATCVLQGAQSMERYYTTNLAYAAAGFPATLQCRQDLADHYTFSATVTAAPALGYTISATPKAGSRQAAKDTACAVLSVNQAGTKSKSGTAAKVSDCW